MLRDAKTENDFVASDSLEPASLFRVEDKDIEAHVDDVVQDQVARNHPDPAAAAHASVATFGELEQRYRRTTEVRPDLETAVVQGLIRRAAPPRGFITTFLVLSYLLIGAEALVGLALVVVSVATAGPVAAIGALFVSLLLLACCLLAGSGLGGLLGRALPDPLPGQFTASPSGAVIDSMKLIGGIVGLFLLLGLRFAATRDVLFPMAALVLASLVILTRGVYWALEHRRDSCKRLTFKVAEKQAHLHHERNYELAMRREGGWHSVLMGCLARHVRGTRPLDIAPVAWGAERVDNNQPPNRVGAR